MFLLLLACQETPIFFFFFLSHSYKTADLIGDHMHRVFFNWTFTNESSGAGWETIEKIAKKEREREREIRLICMNEWSSVGVNVKRFSFIIIWLRQTMCLRLTNLLFTIAVKKMCVWKCIHRSKE
jgi:hypothetical protein